MEQTSKQLLKKISEKVATLTDKKISQIAHAPKESEWRTYISQSEPHWEDIAWRVKEPNSNGGFDCELKVNVAVIPVPDAPVTEIGNEGAGIT